jgi:hypothetical protein
MSRALFIDVGVTYNRHHPRSTLVKAPEVHSLMMLVMRTARNAFLTHREMRHEGSPAPPVRNRESAMICEEGIVCL